MPWREKGKLKFRFDVPSALLVQQNGELCVIEYGESTLLGPCRAFQTRPDVLSIRLRENPRVPDQRLIAYTVDAQTIHVSDLNSAISVAMISHDAKVDWLEV